MRLIDEEYTRHPFYGSRRMAVWLKEEKGHEANRKRDRCCGARRLMRLMGLEAIYPRATGGLVQKDRIQGNSRARGRKETDRERPR